MLEAEAEKGKQAKQCSSWDFPGGPELKTQSCQCREHEFNPSLRPRIPHAAWQKKKKNDPQMVVSQLAAAAYLATW